MRRLSFGSTEIFVTRLSGCAVKLDVVVAAVPLSVPLPTVPVVPPPPPPLLLFVVPLNAVAEMFAATRAAAALTAVRSRTTATCASGFELSQFQYNKFHCG